MALTSVAVKRPPEKGDSTERFVGIKMDNPDADELGALYGLPPGTGGSDIFRAMVKEKLVQEGILNEDGTPVTK